MDTTPRSVWAAAFEFDQILRKRKLEFVENVWIWEELVV